MTADNATPSETLEQRVQRLECQMAVTSSLLMNLRDVVMLPRGSAVRLTSLELAVAKLEENLKTLSMEVRDHVYQHAPKP